MNWNLLKCLFNQHKYSKYKRLDDERIKKHCMYCCHEVVIYRSKVDESIDEIINYLKEGSFGSAKLLFDETMDKLGYKW